MHNALISPWLIVDTLGAKGFATRLRRILGVFAAGRILNAKTVRSQAIGRVIWGPSCFVGLRLRHVIWEMSACTESERCRLTKMAGGSGGAEKTW